MKKRLLSLALCLALCLGLFPFGVLAEEVTEEVEPTYVAVVTSGDTTTSTSYTSIDEAFTHAQEFDSATVTLLNDATIQNNNGIELNEGNITFDLNGHILTRSFVIGGVYYTPYVFKLCNSSNLIIKDDSSEATGKINQKSDYCAIYMMGSPSLTVESGTINVANGSEFNNSSIYMASPNPQVTIHGGTFNGKNAVYLYAGSLTVTGSPEFNGGGLYVTTTSYSPKISLSGGTFSKIQLNNGMTLADLLAAKHRYTHLDNSDLTTDELSQNTISNIKIVSGMSPIFYVDGNTTDYQYIESNTSELTGGFYVVSGNVTVSSLNVTDDVSLILCDDAELNVTGAVNIAADKTMTVYWQTKGTGKLVASNGIIGTLAGDSMIQTTDDSGSVTLTKCMEHKWKYEQVSENNQHIATCSVCGHAEATVTCGEDTAAIRYTSNGDGTHQKRCVCGRVLDKNEDCTYSGTWTEKDDTRHAQVCSACQGEKLELHTFDESGKCTVCSAQIVATYHDTKYTSLTSALNAAAENGSGTVTLVSNVDLDRKFLTLYSGTVTLDLNGKKLVSHVGEGLLVIDGANVTITNGTIENTQDITGAVAAKVMGGSLTLDSGAKLVSHAHKVAPDSSNSSNTSSSPNEKQTPSVIVSGGSLSVLPGVELTGGISITGGNVTLSGGTIYSGKAEYTYACPIIQSETSSLPKDFLADGYAFADENGNVLNGWAELTADTVQVVSHPSHNNEGNGACSCGMKIVASIGQTYYTDLSEAISQANSSDTVKLLANVTTDTTISASLTLDLNGKNVTKLTAIAEATVKDSGESKGTIGKLTVTDGKLVDLLEEGYVFASISSEDIQNGYANSTASNVTIISHQHEWNNSSCVCGLVCDHAGKWKDGKCTVCNYACPHNAGATESGGVYTCNTCGQTVTAKLVASDGTTTTYYADGYLGNNQKSGLYFAINAAESGSTLTVLGGKFQSGFVKGSKTLTLDVSNGKAVNGTLNVGYNDTENKLTIIGNAEIGGIIVDPNNTLDLTRWTGKINGDLTIKWGGKATLNGGTFANILIRGQSAGSLLADGYAFQQIEGGAYVSYSSTEDMENVKVVKCPHTSVTDGTCNYCNATGFVAAITKNDVTHVYLSMEDALTAAASGDTVTLLANADALTINKSIKLDANGKTIGKLTVSDGVTLSGLLPTGYAYKSGEKWIPEPSGTALESVTMAMAPIQSLDYQDSFSILYGTVDSIVVNAILANGVTGNVTYQWYKVKDGEAESIAGATGNSFALNAPMLPVGTHTFRCFATCNDYTMKSSDIVVTVTKSNITSAAITRPTALGNLIYTGNAQELIQPGNATDGTMQYSTEQNGTYSTAIPTGTNAGEYTVWYMVKGDANHNDTEPASIHVSIGKATPEYTVPTDRTATYGQKLADVTLPAGWSWENSAQAVGNVGENSFKATYTPDDRANYNSVIGIDVPVTVKPASYEATVSMTGYTYGEPPSTPSVNNNPEKGTVTYYYSTTNTNSGGTVWPADTQLDAGTYYLYAVIGATTNYQAVTTAAVPFTVSPKSLAGAEVTLEGSLSYNTRTQSPKLTVTLGGKTLAVDTDYDITGNSGTNAGTYKLDITGKDNYTGTIKDVEWKIDPAPLSLKMVESIPKTYDKNTSADVIVTFYGLLNGETLTAEDYTVTAQYDSADAGDTKQVTGQVTLNDTDTARNYVLSNGGNFTITSKIAKAKQTITAENITATYGDTGKKVTATGIGALTYLVETSDIAVGADGSLSFQKAGTYTVKISAAGDTNHEAETTSITVTVAKKAVTVKANDKSAYVGSTAPDLTTVTEKDYTVTGLVGEDKLENITVKLAYADDLDMTKTGTCAIKATVEGTDDRYSFTTEDGTLTITTRPSSGGSGNTDTKTDIVKNPDGSTTKTETKSDGSKTETTTATTPGGSTGSTVTKTDTKGNSKTEASAKLSDKDVKDAQEKGEAVTVPVKDIEAGKDSNNATEIKIDLPKNSGKTTVEIPVDNVTSGTVAVIVHPDGTEEIAKSSKPTEDGVQLEINGSTTVKIIDNSKDFIDTQDHWSRDEVNFVAARELFNGVGDNRFGVSQPMTRGMVNTVLARLSGVDTTPGQDQTWYEIGTEWAKKNGISDGTNPTGNVTREQLATLLYRYAGSPAVDGTLSFADASSVSDYAKNALLWANQNGIVSGVGNNTIAPKANAQRAQVAAMFARYLKGL